MGKALGRRLIKTGYEVCWGSRSPEKAKKLADSVGPQATGGAYVNAASFGEVIVLVSSWQHTQSVIEAAGPLQGKILIDATKPEKAEDYGLEIGHTTSGAELIAKWAKGAKVVKAFNHIYAEVVDEVEAFGTEEAAAFYCGDDIEAKRTVASLIRNMEFDPIDCGPLQNARYLEPLAQLMVQLVRVQEMAAGNISFKLLKRANGNK